jgi:hypothetical protein
MAASKCGTCNSSAFEIKVAEPRDSQFKLSFVQCASCGSVAGVMDYRNTGHDAALLAKQVKDLGSHIDSRFSRIDAILSQLASR